MADTDPELAEGFPLADHDAAMAVRRAVLGDAHVDRAVATASPLTAPFQDLATTVAWGGLWSRDGLERADRSLVTIGILAALGRTDELRMHLSAALSRTGADRGAIVEVLLHVGVYAGLPAANEGFRLLAEVADELDGPGAPDRSRAPGGANAHDGSNGLDGPGAPPGPGAAHGDGEANP